MCFRFRWFRVLYVISMLVWLIFVAISGWYAARASGTSDAVFHQEEQEDFHVLLVSQLDAKWVLVIWIVISDDFFWWFFVYMLKVSSSLNALLFDWKVTFFLDELVSSSLNALFFDWKVTVFLDELPCICNFCCSLFFSASYEQTASWIFDVWSWLWPGLSHLMLLVEHLDLTVDPN